ncbi:MAG: hypothetical protein J5817_11725, partial [Treponema sp.]|nr:hypothetical protein [Treponema sp.]
MKMRDLTEIQYRIGYNFQNSTLLEQAFVSSSVTTATNGKILNYQILEFIGDSVLNLAVVRNLTKEFCTVRNDGQLYC